MRIHTIVRKAANKHVSVRKLLLTICAIIKIKKEDSFNLNCSNQLAGNEKEINGCQCVCTVQRTECKTNKQTKNTQPESRQKSAQIVILKSRGEGTLREREGEGGGREEEKMRCHSSELCGGHPSLCSAPPLLRAGRVWMLRCRRRRSTPPSAAARRGAG